MDKEKTYNIIANFGRDQYVLTDTTPLHFDDAARYNPYDLGTEEAAISLFNSLGAAELASAGWTGYHTIRLYLEEYTVYADGDVNTRTVAEKTVIVDTMGG